MRSKHKNKYCLVPTLIETKINLLNSAQREEQADSAAHLPMTPCHRDRFHYGGVSRGDTQKN